MDNLIWATDDGTWGTTPIFLVDTSEWSKKQLKWLERLTESGVDIYPDDLENIDNNIEPDWSN